MIKVISTSVHNKTNEVLEQIEMNFPAEKKQEMKVLKWLKNIRDDHQKKKYLNRKLNVQIIHL